VRDITDLRQAMASETADLAPRLGAEEILQAGRRRARRRPVVAAMAGVALVAVAVPVAVWGIGAGDGGVMVGGAPPSVSPPPVSPRVVTSTGPPDRRLAPFQEHCPDDAKAARAIGDTIWTRALNSKGEELVVRFVENDKADTDTAGFAIGLGDSATGTLADLGCTFAFSLPPTAADFEGVSAEFDGPVFNGPGSTTTIVDTFVGPADRITATYDGRPLTVELRRWSAYPQVVVYWITGVPADQPVNPRDADHPLVTIYDAAGNVIGPAK
jgi:hypothetical protein